MEYKPSANSDSWIVGTSEIRALSMPKASDWQCQLVGGPMGIVFVPSEGNEPNWFHRKMQELCFGFKWRKR